MSASRAARVLRSAGRIWKRGWGHSSGSETSGGEMWGGNLPWAILHGVKFPCAGHTDTNLLLPTLHECLRSDYFTYSPRLHYNCMYIILYIVLYFSFIKPEWQDRIWFRILVIVHSYISWFQTWLNIRSAGYTSTSGVLCLWRSRCFELIARTLQRSTFINTSREQLHEAPV